MSAIRSIPYLALFLLAACATVPRTASSPTLPPDAGKRTVAPNGMVSSANPLASEAGVEMLRAGGNAVDAAVATAFAIGVVEPQMSGLGGSGSALVWLDGEAHPFYLDFYASQKAESFRGHTDGPRGPTDLRIVGIPGNVAGLLELHDRWGALPRERVMAPAIRLAEDGFPVGQVLAGMIAGDSAELSRFPDAWSRYWPGGRPLREGVVFRNPDLAASLRRVAADGRAGFYEGPIADRIVATLNAGGHPTTKADLAAYETRWMRPLCTDYRGLTVLSAPPPQTGIQVLHTLELLEPYDLRALGLPTRSAEAFDVVASALRVGMAAREDNADPAWAAVPAAGLASQAFARSRAGLVGTGRATPAIEAADASTYDASPPPGACGRYDPYGPAQPITRTTEGAQPAPEWLPSAQHASHPKTRSSTQPAPQRPSSAQNPLYPATRPSARPSPSPSPDSQGETTHISVVDRDGNAVALTQTNSTLFGSGAWVAGFFLNDSGFRFTDRNIDAPSLRDWRTRTSTIAPTIVLDGTDVAMVVGAPGGGRIPTAIAQVMAYTLDYGMDPLDAVRMPRMFPSLEEPVVQLEHGYSPAVLRDVRAMGYEPAPSGFGYARIYAIVRRGSQWIGVADPRHDGEPRGH